MSDARTAFSPNWLVLTIAAKSLQRTAERYAQGVVIDIGCGEKPKRRIFEPFVAQHIGLDHPTMQHNSQNVDIFATAYYIPSANNSFDTVLCTAVLEHLEEPLHALQEAYRVLKPGGYAIYTVPFFWHLHEEPRDFYRYTKYGLQYLFTKASFEIVELRPLSGFVVTFASELCYFLQRFRHRPLGWLIAGMQFLIQWTAYQLNRWDQSYGFTWIYLVVARKRSR